MARPKSRGELKQLNMNIDARLFEKLSEVNVNTGIPKTTVVEKALRDYFNKYEKELNAFGMNN